MRIFHPPEKAETGSFSSPGAKPMLWIMRSARLSMEPASATSSFA